MKFAYIIVCISFGCTVNCQTTNRIAAIFNWDSLIKEYNIYYSLNCTRTDTIFKTKDSIVISFLSHENKILKRETDCFQGNTYQKTDSIIEYYNKYGLKEFYEAWDCVSVTYDSPIWGNATLIERYRRIKAMRKILMHLKYFI